MLTLAVATLVLGAPPLKPSDVNVNEDVRSLMGQRVVVHGQVERVPMGKGAGTWEGTAVLLDDDTTLYVSYREPPPGWETLVGTRVKVEGLLSPSLTDHEQSLLAPHLRSPGTPEKEPRPLPSLVGKRVRLSGLARNAKGGAVLLVDGHPLYLAGLAAWPDAVEGKQVAAGGTLTDKQHLPVATRDAKGAISQGVEEGSSQLVLDAPTWRVFSAPPPPAKPEPKKKVKP